jgi:predicted lipid-binding transport protein (Tim44 family)
VKPAGVHHLPGAAALASTGPGIGRHAAQQLARRELSKAAYQPSLAQRFLDWLGRLGANINVGVPGGWWALVTFIVVLVLVAAIVIFQIRPARSRRSRVGALLQGQSLSAQDHRQRSERSAAAAEDSAAIIERIRAIAVELEERGILPPRPGRTADELAADASRALGAHAAKLTAAARLFDDVMYGGRDGTQAGYQRVRELDNILAAARPGGSAALLPAGAPAAAAAPGPVP